MTRRSKSHLITLGGLGAFRVLGALELSILVEVEMVDLAVEAEVDLRQKQVPIVDNTVFIGVVLESVVWVLS